VTAVEGREFANFVFSSMIFFDKFSKSSSTMIHQMGINPGQRLSDQIRDRRFGQLSTTGQFAGRGH